MIKYCTNLKSINIYQHLTKNKKCGYCKTGKEVYNSNALCPVNFCIDAYYTAYPYLLSLLYDAKFDLPLGNKNSIVVNCPNVDDPASIKIGFKFKKTKLALNTAEKIFRKLGYPKDVIDKLIKLEVLNRGQRCKLKEEGVYEIKIPNIKEFCPASFFSIYPLIHLHNKDKDEFIQKNSTSEIRLFCPDPATDIAYNIDFNKNSCQNGQSCPKKIRISANQFSCLSSLSKFKIITLSDEKCGNKSWQKKEIALKDILSDGLCPFVFNIALPYVITFQNGGYFKWSKNINSVKAQCPNPGGKVEFEIKKDPADKTKISLKIKRAKNGCLFKHKENQVFNFDFSKIICPHLFVRIFPHLLLLANDKEGIYKDGIAVSCPFKKNIKYKIIKNK